MPDTYPTEVWPADANAIALGGETDSPTGLPYLDRGVGSDSSPTLEVQHQRRQERQNRELALANAGRVVDEGDLDVGVYPFDYRLGGTAKHFAGATGQACADDGVNYVYVDSANALQIVTDATGWPADLTSFVPLAEVTCASGDITAISDVRNRAAIFVPSITAGDGIDVSALTVTADVSDFAGAGLEDDGSNNLRIAAAAAGDGIQGGAGSALAIDVSDFAGAGLEDDGSENLRIAAAAAGDGLQGGAGSALAVDVSDFAGEGVEDDGSENLRVKLDGATIGRSASGVKVADNNLDGRQQANVGANGGVPMLFTATLTAGSTVAIHNANAPFKYRVLDAWSVATSADAGTWKLDNGTNDITNAVAVTATDKTINRAGTIDDAYHEIAANGSLRVVGDGSLADVIVYVLAVRVS